ncbi:acetyltransferase [Planomicrobium sp. CPCC 101110]|uniref:acetyltransferase n=1 Tax=Planomicrobium sp. CPCC 101110 TaxID=2599619 RepID=UPI0011B71DBE|nr:acetyltransferase [Planomicrobium sp. CPCC 101110]TWT27780.1 acetyltransferase [Planomicrobium sp. CPCC 101110]
MNIILIGDSGHARVIYDNVISGGNQVVAKLDDKYTELFKEDGCWIGPISEVYGLIEKEEAKVVIAIGANTVRRKIVEQLSLDASCYATAIHKDAIVSPSAVIGHGTVIMPGAIVNAAASVGNHSILNSRIVVEHDCKIGDFVHVSPGAVVAGGAKIKEGALIETGAAIIPMKQIGQWSIVKAGSVVMDDIAEISTATGVPARITKNVLL